MRAHGLWQPYRVLLLHCVDFKQFLLALQVNHPDFRDRQLLIGLVQMLWDRLEPNGYSHHLDNLDRLPDTATKACRCGRHSSIIKRPGLGGHIMAQAVGAVHLDSGVRDVFGLETVTSTTRGRCYTKYDFGLPGVPSCNLPGSRRHWRGRWILTAPCVILAAPVWRAATPAATRLS